MMPTQVAQRRHGGIAILAAVLLVLVLMMVAFAVDVGCMMNAKTELQAAADAAALAGAGAIADGPEKAKLQASHFAKSNGHGRNQRVVVDTGMWDSVSRSFTASSKQGNAVRVTVLREKQPLFFARVMHKGDFGTQATAVALPISARDFMFVLDASATMNDDSELKSIGLRGRPTVESNLQTIYRELGSRQLGSMKWTPHWITAVGKRSTGASQPQITVTFKGDSVDITSTKDLSNVVLGFPRGGRQKFEGLTGLTGTFSGTGSNAKSRIEKVWVKSGSNKSGDGPGYGELFQDDIPTIKRALGLDKVRYPYSSGSWDDYITYVKTSTTNVAAGYQDKFGYLNWVNYLLEMKPAQSETPDLWQTSSLPMRAAKDASMVVLSQLAEASSSDRAGLLVFSAKNDVPQMEIPLTTDFGRIERVIRERQAGHYALPADLGGALADAREELQAKGRPSAAKFIVLVSDGRTEKPVNANEAWKHALAQADAAAAAKVRIITISVGTKANKNLLRDIAQRTDGVYFHMETASALESQLADALKTLTPQSPPRLVF
jgi:hypothetical protein